MTFEPTALLREALANLAADPAEQERRLAGAVIQDELALDVVNAFESCEGRPEAAETDTPTMSELHDIGARLSVDRDDPLWSEALNSARWSEIRCLAAQVLGRT